MRVPTRNGLAISPYELGCTVPTPEQFETRGLVTMHHNQFNRERYTDMRYMLVFRGLITNVYPLLNPDHIDLHIRYDPPQRPKPWIMIDTVDEYLETHGVVDVVREKKTRTHYSLSADEWSTIKNGYTRTIK